MTRGCAALLSLAAAFKLPRRRSRSLGELLHHAVPPFLCSASRLRSLTTRIHEETETRPALAATLTRASAAWICVAHTAQQQVKAPVRARLEAKA